MSFSLGMESFVFVDWLQLDKFKWFLDNVLVALEQKQELFVDIVETGTVVAGIVLTGTVVGYSWCIEQVFGFLEHSLFSEQELMLILLQLVISSVKLLDVWMYYKCAL